MRAFAVPHEGAVGPKYIDEGRNPLLLVDKQAGIFTVYQWVEKDLDWYPVTDRTDYGEALLAVSALLADRGYTVEEPPKPGLLPAFRMPTKQEGTLYLDFGGKAVVRLTDTAMHVSPLGDKRWTWYSYVVDERQVGRDVEAFLETIGLYPVKPMTEKKTVKIITPARDNDLAKRDLEFQTQEGEPLFWLDVWSHAAFVMEYDDRGEDDWVELSEHSTRAEALENILRLLEEAGYLLPESFNAECEPSPEPAQTEGFVKHDDQKPAADLVPPRAIEQVARVLAFGARKYDADNWIKCDRTRRYPAAAMRHLWAWFRGETNDPESGLPHLAHAACCVLFALELERLADEGKITMQEDRPFVEGK